MSVSASPVDYTDETFAYFNYAARYTIVDRLEVQVGVSSLSLQALLRYQLLGEPKQLDALPGRHFRPGFPVDMAVELGYANGGDNLDGAGAGFLGATISVPYFPATPYLCYRYHMGEYIDHQPSYTTLPFEYRVLYVGVELSARLRVEYFHGDAPSDNVLRIEGQGVNVVYSMPID